MSENSPNEPEVRTNEQIILKLRREVVAAIAACPIGSEIEVFEEVLRPNPAVIPDGIQYISSELMLAAQDIHPDKIESIGAAVMGLAFPGSSLDFYISCPKPDEITEEWLQETRNSLEKYNIFKHFEEIFHKVPILKCVHVETGLKCILNFTEANGLTISKILEKLLNFDRRILSLAVIIKFWMKANNLISPKILTSYDVLWLLLFYLQQGKDPLLPPIREFQLGIRPQYIDDVNVAFNYNLRNTMNNNDDLGKLLVGFFTFYERFDFQGQFISPLHGKAFPRLEFEEEYRIVSQYRPDEMMIDQISKAVPQTVNYPICIQDPFNVCQMKPGKISGSYFRFLKNKIVNTARACVMKFTETDADKELLLTLFENELFLPYIY